MDCDLLIQKEQKRLLRDIIREDGMDAFLEIEADTNAALAVEDSIIAPGGSVILRDRAMQHLKEISYVVYLKISYRQLRRRIGDPVKRGVAMRPGKTLRDLYEERSVLYEQYADWTIDEKDLMAADIVDLICERMQSEHFTK